MSISVYVYAYLCISIYIDEDFNNPLPEATGTTGTTTTAAPTTVFQANADGIDMLGAMGFTSDQAVAALTSTANDIERAADWLFSHSDDLDGAVAGVMNPNTEGSGSSGSSSGCVVDTSNLVYDTSEHGCYDVVAVISHLGRNTTHGHYVCHIKKESKWVMYNDDKVMEAKNPPLKYGFMYLYKRRDV